MKKEFKHKKKILVGGLAVLCCCLVVGLFYYLGGMGGTAPDTIIEETPQDDIAVSVPDISAPDTEASGISGQIVPAPIQSDTSSGDSDTTDRPKSPDEAIPPEAPTVENEDDLTNPEQPPAYTPEQTEPSANTGTPQGGDTNGSGQVWIPGFGWVTPSNEPNSQGTAPNAGTGDPIGDM